MNECVYTIYETHSMCLPPAVKKENIIRTLQACHFAPWSPLPSVLHGDRLHTEFWMSHPHALLPTYVSESIALFWIFWTLYKLNYIYYFFKDFLYNIMCVEFICDWNL
jgi:hypothetical protein